MARTSQHDTIDTSHILQQQNVQKSCILSRINTRGLNPFVFKIGIDGLFELLVHNAHGILVFRYMLLLAA